MGPTWGPSGADRAQVGPMLAPMNFAIWVVTVIMIVTAEGQVGQALGHPQAQ